MRKKLTSTMFKRNNDLGNSMTKKQVVTPYEVQKEAIDYDRLIKEFGMKPLKGLPAPFNDFLQFRRGIIFAHRDFDKIVEAYHKKKPFVMMTGLMPSGKMHFGHKMIADQIIFYQSIGAKIYLAVADIEAYNSRNNDIKELRRLAIEEYLTNYVALGLDLQHCDFYFQSKRSTNGKKSNEYYSLANMFGAHVTFNEFKAVYGSVSPGKVAASLLQASDMYHPQLSSFEGKPLPIIIPVGADQDPHIRLARDIAKRFKTQKFLPISSTYNKFMQGLKGGKMSSSDQTSFIALTDTPKVVEKKITKYAFSGGQDTLEKHRMLGGNPDIDIAFQMLRFGLEPDDEKLKKLEKEYRSGKILSGEMKKLLIDKITAFLKVHHKKRENAKKIVATFVKEKGF